MSCIVKTSVTTLHSRFSAREAALRLWGWIENSLQETFSWKEGFRCFRRLGKAFRQGLQVICGRERVLYFYRFRFYLYRWTMYFFLGTCIFAKTIYKDIYFTQDQIALSLSNVAFVHSNGMWTLFQKCFSYPRCAIFWCYNLYFWFALSPELRCTNLTFSSAEATYSFRSENLLHFQILSRKLYS